MSASASASVSAQQWLFVYGTLGPRDDEDARSGRWTPDAVRGRLYDLGLYPALVDCADPTADWSEGYVRVVEPRELTERLDPYEGVDEGLYRRIEVQTRGGSRVWVYEYAQPLPATARGPLARWRPNLRWNSSIEGDQGFRSDEAAS